MVRFLTTEEFIRKAILKHGECYNYKKVVYKDLKTKVIITCLKHGECYNYEKVVYENAHVKVIITCPKHGDFEQEPQSHLQGSGCPKCSQCQYSKVSIEWIKYIQSSINKEIQSVLSNDGEYVIPSTRFRADGYCKETNTIYEFLGDFWHGNPKIYNLNDINSVLKKSYGELYKQTHEKKMKIIELGYNYIEIWERDWYKAVRAVIKIQRLWKKYKGINI